MSLRLIYGKIGSGKTSLCMKEALGCEKNVYYITPEQFTFTAENRMCRLANVHGLGGVEVLSFKKLAARFLSETDGAALPRLSSRTKLILLQKILVDASPKLTVLNKLAKEPGTAGVLGKLFGEMKRYNISASDLRNASKDFPHMEKKLCDIALLFEKYLEAVKDKFLDRDDDLFRFSKLVAGYTGLEKTEIYFDRFDGFDASEYAAIAALLQKGVRITVTLCYHPQDEKKPAFVLHAKMAKHLLGIAKESGAEIEPSVILDRPRTCDPSLLFLENAFFTYPTPIYEKNEQNISLVTAQNPLGEVHHVAREVLKLCREKGYLYRDIAICARNLGGYERYLEAVLPAYGIPFFMDRTIQILEHPFTVFVLSALEILVQGYTYETMFRYIKSGFLHLPSETIDTLENYVLATGIHGDVWKNEEKWNVKLSVYADKETTEEEEWISASDSTRKKIVAPLMRLHENLKKNASARGKCEALYAFLQEMKVERRIRALCRIFEKQGEYARSAEYKGVYNDFIDALDGICDAFGEESIGIRRLYDVLRTALGEVETGFIPSAQDGVSVGSIDRVKGYAVKALFVIGTQEGVFPAPLERGGLLSDLERKMLSDAGLDFADAENKTRFEEEHLIYKCLTIPSESIAFSFPSATMEGATLLPSRVFERIQEIFPKIQVENLLLGLSVEDKISVPDITMQYVMHDLRNHAAGKAMREAYGWLLEKNPEKTNSALGALSHQNMARRLSPKTIEAYMGDTHYSSVSRLEKLSACPFSYFATYMLGAQERKILKPNAADAGRFLHDFLDVFSKRLRENGKTWQEVDDGYIDEEFREIVPLLDRRLSAYMLEKSPRFYQLFLRLQSAVRLCVSMLASHMKSCAFEPLGYELSFAENGDLKPVSFTLPGGGEVKLTGRIDRADILRMPENEGAFLRIIDYKSGTRSFALDDVYFGLNLQLAVYISALCSPENACIVGENAKPAGMLYFRLMDPLIDASPMEEDAVIALARKKQFKLQGLVLSDAEVLQAMDKNIGKSSDVLPANFTKTGIGGSVADSKQFALLSRHVKKTVTKLLTALADGDIRISPYRKGDASACAYCRFSSFCSHEGTDFRLYDKLGADEIWKEMEKEA